MESQFSQACKIVTAPSGYDLYTLADWLNKNTIDKVEIKTLPVVQYQGAQCILSTGAETTYIAFHNHDDYLKFKVHYVIHN